MFIMRKLINQHLKIFTVFSSLTLITGCNSQTASSVDIDFSVGDGQEFIKRIANGEKVPEHPGILMFTAPYRLCDGGCKGSVTNIAVGFPLYIGKRGREAYKKIYLKDFKKIHSGNPHAPLKRKTTRAPYTLPNCSVININVISTVPTTTVSPTSACPYIIPGTCIKYKKSKKNRTRTDYNPIDNQGRVIVVTHGVENNNAMKAIKHTSGFEKLGRETYYENNNKKFTDLETEKTIATPKIEKLNTYNYKKNIQVPDVQTTTAKILNIEVPIKQVIDDRVSDQSEDVKLSDTQTSTNQFLDAQLPDSQITHKQYPDVQLSDMPILSEQLLDKQVSETHIPFEIVPDMPLLSKQDVQVSDMQIPPKQIPNIHVSDTPISAKQVSHIQVSNTQISAEQITDVQVADMQKSNKKVLPEQVTDRQISDTQISPEQVPDIQVSEKQIPTMQVSDTQIPPEQIPDVQSADTRAPYMQFSHMHVLNEPVKLSDTQDPREQLSTEPVPNSQVPKLQIPTVKVSELRNRQNIQNELFDEFVQYLRHRYG